MKSMLVRFRLATVGLFAVAACGGNLRTGGDAGSGAVGSTGPASGSSSSATTATASTSTTSGAGGGSTSSTGTGGSRPGDCTPNSCDGLGVTDDARLCPDGSVLVRSLCRRIGDRCGWDFPDCPTGPAPMDASPGPVRRPIPECPLIPASQPGMPSRGCLLAGRWSLNSSHGIVQSTGVVEFGSDGSYYGGPTGTDLSQTYTYDGAYRISIEDRGDVFHLLYSCGDGCNGLGNFDLEFQAGCSVATLTETTTECTGNRRVMAGKVVLIRQ